MHVLVELTPARELLVQVSDDGVGIRPDAHAKSDSFGLTSMRQRVTALGGKLEVRCGHHKDDARGTTVTATVPMSKE